MSLTAEALYHRSPIWMQNLLVSSFGYYLFRRRYSGNYHDILQQVRLSREWNVQEVYTHQSEQLHAMAAYCRHHIPWYQKLFADHGLHENDFTRPEDVRKLPVLDKQTLRKHHQDFRAPGAKPFMVQHTSGSTGTPLSLAVDARTYRLAMALLVDHEEYHGVPFGARRATFAGRMIQPSERMTPPFWRMNRAENQQFFSSYHLNDQTFPWYRDELERFRPLEIIGYPSAIFDLAMHFRRSGSRPAFSPKIIVTNSETVLPHQRETMESVFGCPVMDYYGTAEYVLFAGQGSDHHYHPSPLPGITELAPNDLDSETRVLTATTLTNRTMPLLRYEIGDTAIPAYPSEPAIGTPVLASISGRKDDYVETSDGRRIGRLDHIFKGVEGIKEAQVVQDRPGSITLRLVEDGLTEINQERLMENCRQRLGEGTAITVERLSQIPRAANGKFRSVVRCEQC